MDEAGIIDYVGGLAGVVTFTASEENDLVTVEREPTHGDRDEDVDGAGAQPFAVAQREEDQDVEQRGGEDADDAAEGERAQTRGGQRALAGRWEQHAPDGAGLQAVLQRRRTSSSSTR